MSRTLRSLTCLLSFTLLVSCSDSKKPVANEPPPLDPPIAQKPQVVQPVDPKSLPTQPAKADPPSRPDVDSDKAKEAVAALQKLGVYLISENTSVGLSTTTDLPRAIELLADLKHVYELEAGPKVTDAQLETLSKLKEVRKLTCNSNEQVTDAGLKHLIGMTKLRSLQLYGLKKVTLSGFEIVAKLPELEELKISYNPLGETGAKSLSGLNKLTVLEAYYCALTPAALAHFAGLTELRELGLSGNEKLNDDALKHIARLTKLEKLALDSTQVTDEGLKHLAKLSNMTHLQLSNTAITDAGLAHLAGMKKLESLNIDRTSVKGPGLKALADCKNLTFLDLDQMPQFTGEGLHHLAGSSKLTTLNLSWTGLTDAGLADIKKLTHLKSLDLPPYGHVTALGGPFWQNPHPERFSDQGLKHIGEMTDLESLYISGSGLTDMGLSHLRGLKKLKTLAFGVLPNIKGPGLESLKDMPIETLRLTETGITDATMKHLGPLKQLTSLALPRTATPAVINELKKMLPGLKQIFTPKGWDEKAVAQMKAAFPKADIFEGD